MIRIFTITKQPYYYALMTDIDLTISGEFFLPMLSIECVFNEVCVLLS